MNVGHIFSRMHHSLPNVVHDCIELIYPMTAGTVTIELSPPRREIILWYYPITSMGSV